jgi:uncharacterized membrane protein YdjX (TVP38/TMEM64 family)
MVAAATAVGLSALPVEDLMLEVLEWTDWLGIWGLVALPLCYVATCTLLLPSVELTLAAGFLLGPGAGTAAASVGNTLGACAAFLVGRTVARGWVERKLAERPRLAALDRAVARDDFLVVFLARLSPINPFNFLNYLLALTRVRFGRYVAATWLGTLPGIVLFVYIGSGLRSLTEAVADETGHALPGVSWVALPALLLVVAAMAFWGKRRLVQELARCEPRSRKQERPTHSRNERQR